MLAHCLIGNRVFNIIECCFTLTNTLNMEVGGGGGGAGVLTFHNAGHRLALGHFNPMRSLGKVHHRSLKFGPYITNIASKPKAHGIIT